MKDFSKIPSNRWNLIVMAVNDGDPKDSITPALNDNERDLYDALSADLAEVRKTYPRACLGPREKEW